MAEATGYNYDTWAKTLTCGDNPQPLTTDDIVLEDVNLHVYDNAIYYGSGSQQLSKANANDVITYRRIRVNTIFFKNYTAGSNGRIEATGVIRKKLVT